MYLRRFYIVLAYVLGLVLSTYAQSIRDIQTSDEYVFGQGSGTTITEATDEALAIMSRSICVKVLNISVEDEYSQGIVLQTISTAQLQNLKTIVLSDEPSASVFCYMHKEEVDKMFQRRKERILDFIEAGKKAEERLQIDDALRCYYSALLMVKTNPHEVDVTFGDENGFASTLLPLKIKSVLQLLKAEVAEGEAIDNKIQARLNFTYNGKPVSSVQFRYHDGQGIIGPVSAKDGLGEVDLVSMPANGKLNITYETRFANEVSSLDTELVALYKLKNLPSFDAKEEVPIKVKKGTVKPGKPSKATAEETEAIAAQPVKEKTPIATSAVSNPDEFMEAIFDVENAIAHKNPKLAYQRFTNEGYKLLDTLIHKTGSVSLVGKSDYEFIEADGLVIGRASKIKIKFSNGKSFTENLVYRFNPQTKKIESIAFRLTKIAENDIMNAATTWPEVSRWAILNFMEDYQTAYALKRLDYIKSIFSDDAIIISGVVLKKYNNTNDNFDYSRSIDINSGSKIKYRVQTKDDYISRLDTLFRVNSYVHLSFENNVTKIINLPSVVNKGAAFGIEIKQRYTSSIYSDEGYLTLFLDTRGELPIIHVRLWQPDKTEMMGLDDFISKFMN